MGDVPSGLYEHLLTAGLDGQLTEIDPALVSTTDLDAVDAHEALTRHIAALVSRSLRAVAGDGQRRVS